MMEDLLFMGLLAISGIAVSVAMDAFSVCIAAGVKIRKLTAGHYFRLAFSFGLFQFLMPVLGYYGGVMIENVISSYDHWIVLILLSFIGIKMIWESFSKDSGDELTDAKDPSRGMTLIMLSIATSIDAAAVGFSFAALRIQILVPAFIIGIVCVVFSAGGLLLGNRIGSAVGVWAERFGGLILIIIGIKILIEHTT